MQILVQNLQQLFLCFSTCCIYNNLASLHTLPDTSTSIDCVEESFYVAKDLIGAKYMQMEHSVCFLVNAVFVMEVPVSEHNRPEVKEEELKETQNFEDYETFEFVRNVEQEYIGSHWVIMQKEKYDRQKQPCKSRLVAR